MAGSLQMALAHDPEFLNRVQYAMATAALVVVNELGTVPGHVLRRAYAQSVLGNPAAAAVSMAVGLVGSINLTSVNTFVNADLSVTTDATDAALFAQVSALWNAYAGV